MFHPLSGPLALVLFLLAAPSAAQDLYDETVLREVHLDDLGDYQFTIRHQRKLLKRLKLTCGVQSKDLKPGALKVIRLDR